MIAEWVDGERPGDSSVLPGWEESGARGSFWRWTQRLRPEPGFPPWPSPHPLGRHPGEDAALRVMEGAGWEGILFLDLETCGFSGTPLFLTGILFWSRGEMVVDQLLARSYAEEAAVVASTVTRIGARPIVSFNGKSYDIPFLVERAGRHGIAFVSPAGHFDLLHASRRRWRRQLPNCRLATLEAAIRGGNRTGDVPGREVPERYHAFVRTGMGRLLLPVLRHNRQDLLAMAGIMARLDQGSLVEPGDLGPETKFPPSWG